MKPNLGAIHPQGNEKVPLGAIGDSKNRPRHTAHDSLAGDRALQGATFKRSIMVLGDLQLLRATASPAIEYRASTYIVAASRGGEALR